MVRVGARLSLRHRLSGVSPRAAAPAGDLMIRSIWSSDYRFKELKFSSDLNILLADRTDTSSDLQTRNRAGKSSLIEIINFLLCSDLDHDDIFVGDALESTVFSMDFDLGGNPTTVSRTGSDPNVFFVLGSDTSNWPDQPKVNEARPNLHLSKAAWHRVLSKVMFGEEVMETNSHSPSLRQLLGYYVRREGAGGYQDPFTQNRRQQDWDKQVANIYLLGLDWTIPQQLQILKDRNSKAVAATKAAKRNTRGVVRLQTSGELRAQLTSHKERLRLLLERVNSFEVLDEYAELEEEASHITRELADISNRNVLDLQFRKEMSSALTETTPAPRPDLETLYREIGVALPNTTLQRFDDVAAFHESVVRNRRRYLESQINEIDQEIARRLEEQRTLDARRAEIMGILQAHGALEQYNELQRQVGKIESHVATAQAALDEAVALENSMAQFEFQKSQLYLRLQQDFEEQGEVLQHALTVFESVSAQLYGEGGSLSITPTESGPEFNVQIQGSNSRGISNMQIFCYDMMLMQLSFERGIGPGFLIHDSHIFDGVDERQIARAIEIGDRMSKEFNFQYIMTMNSDDLPNAGLYSADFLVEDHFLPVRLTDQNENGGLFGFRF
jgi:uncharacterized protein YydD (DUF2326 family)